MNIRTATMDDLDIIAELEKKCFPPAEAASKESFEKRLTYFPNHFYLLFDGDKLISFVNGMVTDESDLTDEMYDDASLHNEEGAWQMIFGVNTDPDYRKKGYASQVLRHVIEQAKKDNRKGLVLTCKDKLIPLYSSLGFENEGVSESTHGGAVWNKMRLTF